MIKNISSDKFADELVSLMKSYTEEVEEEVSEEVEKCGNEGAEELKRVNLPIGVGGTATPSERKDWKKYSKKWKNKFEKGYTYSSSTIHNSSGLVHLLENGHATRDGQRTRAFPHVQPVEEKITNQLFDNIKKIIEKGGKQ